MRRRLLLKKFMLAIGLFVILCVVVSSVNVIGAGDKDRQEHKIDSPNRYEIKISTDDTDDNEAKYQEGEYPARLRAPNTKNPYYYSSRNVFYECGFGIPNCTAYAWGRLYELMQSEPKLCTADAGYWYGYNKNNEIYDYGQEPKLGAIACWDNEEGGHVAVVEEINDDIIRLSNSAYMGTAFFMTELDSTDENLGYVGWEFQGFIYAYEG